MNNIRNIIYRGGDGIIFDSPLLASHPSLYPLFFTKNLSLNFILNNFDCKMKSVMIVDDEKNILDEVKNILEENEFNVTTAENSRKAFELMETKKENNFGLILIDSQLPDSKKPALFSMKPSNKKNIDTTKKEDFLTKPFTKSQLVEFVKKKL